MMLPHGKSGRRISPIDSVDVTAFFTSVIYFYMVFVIFLISRSYVVTVIWWICLKWSTTFRATVSFYRFFLDRSVHLLIILISSLGSAIMLLHFLHITVRVFCYLLVIKPRLRFLGKTILKPFLVKSNLTELAKLQTFSMPLGKESIFSSFSLVTLNRIVRSHL